jgi:hypothetical protein
MVPRDGIRRYAYWSDRRIRQIAVDNDITLERRLRWTSKIKVPFIGELEIGQEGRTLRRNEIARRIDEVIGELAVADFVTPPPVRFAKGIGRISFSQFVGISTVNEGIVAHTSVSSSNGCRVEVCIFGSVDNMDGYAGAYDRTTSGWVSSAAPAIFAFLESRGTSNRSQWDDPESIAVEALKIATEQGAAQDSEDGKPWTRGFTLSHADGSEWFAEIYADVELDKSRWDLDKAVDRIIIGAPLWIRTPGAQSVTRYQGLRAQPKAYAPSLDDPPPHRPAKPQR